MQETWYVLEDGRAVDPKDVMRDSAGVLKHKSGVAVAMRSPGVARSRGVNPDDERQKTQAAGKPKDLKPEDKTSGYKTRETKAH